MAANQQTIEIKLILRDELSQQLQPIIAELRQLQNVRIDRAHAGMQRFAGAMQFVRREMSSLAQLSLGGLIGGGVVAGIFNATKALGDMARQGMQLRYTAEKLGVSSGFFERMSDGLTALGMSSEQAASSVESAIDALREAETFGKESNLFRTLEKASNKSGLRLWREIQQQMAGPEGAEGAFKFLVTRMQSMAPSGQRALLKSLGISSLAFKDLMDVLPQLNKRVQLSQEDMKRLNVANANFEISMGNVGRILGAAVMPGLAKVTKALSDYLQTDAGKKFARELGEWTDKVGTAIATWIGKGKGQGGLQDEIEGIKTAVAELTAAFNAADPVIQSIGGWKVVLGALVLIPFAGWLRGVGLGLAAIARYSGLLFLLSRLSPAALIALGVLWLRGVTGQDERTNAAEDELRRRNREQLENQPLTPEQRENLGKIPWLRKREPKPEPQSGEGQPKTEQERRADMLEEKRQRAALTEDLKLMAYDVRKFNDHTMAGGPEGSADGRSGYGAGLSEPSVDPILTGSSRRGGGQQQRAAAALEDVQKYLAEKAAGGDLKRMQRAVERVAPGSDEEWLLRQERVLKSLDPSKGGIAPSQWQGGRLPEEGELKGIERGMEQTRKEYEKHPTYDQPGWLQDREDFKYNQGPLYGSGLVVPPGMPINLNRFSGSGGSTNIGGDTTNLFGGNTTINAIARGGGLNETGMSGITRTLAAQNSINGSATIDIDVGGLGQPERNPQELFRPQPLGGVVQMQNAPHVPHNPLSYQ